MTLLLSARTGIILPVLVLVLLPSLCAGAIQMQAEYRVGNVVTLMGNTNLAAGDQLQVEIISASFTPMPKGQESGFSGISGTVTVIPGTPLNTWTFTFDTTGFRPDEYLVRVESVDVGVIETGSFRLVERLPEPGPETTIPTEGPTAGTATLPVTESPSPIISPKAGGFTGLLALPVLIFLFLRRRT